MDGYALFLEFIEQWAWVGWIILIAAFLVIEMLTLDFTFLMLSLGSVIGLVTAFLGAPVWAQIIIAALTAALLILFLRPPLLKRLRAGADPAKSNVDALIGIRGTALSEISERSGQVKLSNGDTWTARIRTGFPVPPGAAVTVTTIDGATAVVSAATH